jgi:hypothetical protein
MARPLLPLFVRELESDSEVTLIPATGSAARLCRTIEDEAGLPQHLLGRDVVKGGRRSECAQPVLFGSSLTQFLHGRGRHAATRNVSRDPVPELGRAVLELNQIEPAEHVAVLADQDVEDAGASLLLAQQLVERLVEMVEERVAPIGDEGGKVGAVRQLESQYRWGVFSA